MSLIRSKLWSMVHHYTKRNMACYCWEDLSHMREVQNYRDLLKSNLATLRLLHMIECIPKSSGFAIGLEVSQMTSKLKAAAYTDLSQPFQSLLKAICYPENYRFSIVVTRSL